MTKRDELPIYEWYIFTSSGIGVKRKTIIHGRTYARNKTEALKLGKGKFPCIKELQVEKSK